MFHRPLARRSGPLVCAVALLAACGGGTEEAPPARPSKPSATTTPVPGARTPAGRIDMGGGEAPVPQPFTREQRLLDAVRRDDRPTIERALELGTAADVADDLGRNTLLLAARDAGDLELVRFFRERGVPVDRPDLGGRTALSWAAEAGRLDLVQYLVANGAQPDSRDMQQRSPLFHAAQGDQADVIAFLAEHGASLDAADQWGDTPLIVACAKGNARAAALLLARGADPARKDQEGRTARERSAPGTAPCLEGAAAR